MALNPPQDEPAWSVLVRRLPPDSAFDQLNVLVIDDNPADRMMLVAALRKTGFRHIQEAEDGRTGENKLFTALQIGKPYDLVFLDWRMPHMNGLDFVQRIRAERTTRSTCLVMLTGVSDKSKVRDAISSGVDDFILKPLDYETLREKIHQLAERRAWKINAA